MRKNLYLLALLLGGYFSAQESITIFSEDFNNFDKELEWDTMDRDRDGETWVLSLGNDTSATAGWDNENGGIMAVSSYNIDTDNEGPLDSDDVLISPVIEIPNTSEDITLSYKIGVSTDYLQGVKMNDLSYQLFVLEENEPFYPTLTPLDEKRFSDSKTAETKTISLNAYRGKKIKLYWRHYQAFGQFLLMLDDIVIKVKVNTDSHPMIYPNPVQETLYISGIENILSYKIYNMSGRLIMENAYDYHKGINVSLLQEEIYIIVVENTMGSKSFKFIKR